MPSAPTDQISQIVDLSQRIAAGNSIGHCATRLNSMTNGGARSGGTASDYGRAVSVAHTMVRAVASPRLLYANVYNGTNGETPNSNPIVVSAAIVYAQNVYPVTFGGQAVGRVDGGALLWSDPVGVYLPAGAVIQERCVATVSLPPTTLAASAGSGGSLSAATYYYKVTSVTDLGESGPSVEVSAAVSASGSVTVSWADLNTLTATRSFKVYRATTAGGEKYLATVAPWMTSFVDAGAASPATASPPTQQYVPFGFPLNPNNAMEGQAFNQPYVINNPYNFGGFSSVNSPCFSAYAIAGIPAVGDTTAAVALLGDSIMSGTGDLTWPTAINDCGFGVRAINGTRPYLNKAQGGETLVNFQGNARRVRLASIAGCRHAVVNYVTNSLATQSVAQMQASVLDITAAVNGVGAKVWWCTCNPKTASADGWSTITNQTPYAATDGVDANYPSPELRRQAMNAWMRDASAAGYIAQAGGLGKAGVFDTAAAVEANSAGTIVAGGAYYAVGPTYDTGTSTSTSSTSLVDMMKTWTVNVHVGRTVVSLAGATVTWGQVTANTATTLTVAWSSGTPTSSAAYSIYAAYTVDGTHPTGSFGHATMAIAINVGLLV